MIAHRRAKQNRHLAGFVITGLNKLGAHYTPRAYVERLVLPTVIEPLRAEWKEVQVAALTYEGQGNHKEAVAEIRVDDSSKPICRSDAGRKTSSCVLSYAHTHAGAKRLSRSCDLCLMPGDWQPGFTTLSS